VQSVVSAAFEEGVVFLALFFVVFFRLSRNSRRFFF